MFPTNFRPMRGLETDHVISGPRGPRQLEGSVGQPKST